MLLFIVSCSVLLHTYVIGFLRGQFGSGFTRELHVSEADRQRFPFATSTAANNGIFGQAHSSHQSLHVDAICAPFLFLCEHQAKKQKRRLKTPLIATPLRFRLYYTNSCDNGKTKFKSAGPLPLCRSEKGSSLSTGC